MLRFEIGFDETQGRRETMEDTHVELDFANTSSSNPGTETLGFFGVYDGHGGVDAAKLVQQYLHSNIFENEQWKAGDIEGAITEGFKNMDSHIIQLSNERGWMNGSTAVVGLITHRKLYAANVGDSEAILVREKDGQTEIIPLTIPHKASDPKEKERIEKLGGHVFFGRVFGALAVSRSFGDSRFKKPKTTQNFVSWEPAIRCIELQPDVDRFIIFACDGLWDVMNHKEVANFIAKKRLDGLHAPEIAKLLVREALKKRTEDNVTVVIVFLLWSEKEEPKGDVEVPKADVDEPKGDVEEPKVDVEVPKQSNLEKQEETPLTTHEPNQQNSPTEELH